MKIWGKKFNKKHNNQSNLMSGEGLYIFPSPISLEVSYEAM